MNKQPTATAQTVPPIPASWQDGDLPVLGSVTLPSGKPMLHCWFEPLQQHLFFSAQGTGYLAHPVNTKDGLHLLQSFPGGTLLRHRGNPVKLFIVGDLATVVS